MADLDLLKKLREETLISLAECKKALERIKQ
jgi:translation elongation factor EF-Ts